MRAVSAVRGGDAAAGCTDAAVDADLLSPRLTLRQRGKADFTWPFANRAMPSKQARLFERHRLCLDVKKWATTHVVCTHPGTGVACDLGRTLAGFTGKLTLVTNPADLLRQAVASVGADLIGQSPESAPIPKYLSLQLSATLKKALRI